ncbi:hypothetical protein AADZ86_13165 [Colwelliaceae bacterium BS250]
MKYAALILAVTLLTACEGDDPNSANIDPSSDNIVNNDTDIISGDSVELMLFNPENTIEVLSWRQLSGSNVDLLSAKSKVIAFTVPAAGDYTFEVEYLSNGKSVIDSVSISAGSGVPDIVARLGHSVIEGNGVSLRSWVSADVDIESITWQQLSGPTVSFDTDNITKEITIFDAPEVNADQIIELEVTAQMNDGSNVSDTVSILVEDSLRIASDAYFDDDVLATVYPYNADSPVADDIVACVYSNQLSSSCRLSVLPLLATDSNGSTPSIEQIMDRVVVSHDWMGQRFKEYLEAFDEDDNDFKNLLRATTAIVLSYDIRPSFYWAATGAIYLDPNNLWLTPSERDTINEAPDYRANFGSDLQFVMPWRYVKDNEYVSFSFPVNERVTRELVDIKYELADLLYHELAHANDFLPPSEWQSYSSNSRLLDAALAKPEVSDTLDIYSPLQSKIMTDLAAVRFLGETATVIQRAYLPDDITRFYEPDVSNGFYNYTSKREDLGILFEELMMSLRYGVQRDTAVTSGCESADDCYIVDWGQRGRVAKPSVSDRAEYITTRILPEFDINLIANLPAPILMTPGLDWWDNLNISPSPTSLSQKQSKVLNDNRRPKINSYQVHGRALPNH